MATYKVDRPTTQDPDGLIRRSITVTDPTLGNHTQLTRRYTGDPTETPLTNRTEITEWEKQLARKVHSIMVSRNQTDQDRTNQESKWADPVEDSTDNPVEP